MRRTDRSPQPLRAQPVLRVDEFRTQDIGQLHDKSIDVGPDLLRLAVLFDLPEVLKQPKRHRHIAVDDLAVARQCSAQALQATPQQFVGFRANARGSDVPQLEQRPGLTFRDQFSDFPLEPDAVAPHPFSSTGRRDRLDRTVEQPGKRLYRLSIAACSHEHQRKIIAKRGEIPVSGENCRMQIALGVRIERALGHPTREMKRDVCLTFYLHAKIALVVSILIRRIFTRWAELRCPRPAAKS